MLTAWILLETSAPDPIALLINYGVAGIVIVLFITGQIRTKSEVAGLEKQLKEKDDMIQAFTNQLSGNTLPALTRSAQVLEAIPSNERSLYQELNQARAEVLALTKTIAEISQRQDRHDDSRPGA